MWFARVPALMMVLDLASFHKGLQPNRRSRAIERATLPLGLRRAAAITTISQSTAGELVARFPAAAEKASVTLLAADRASVRPSPATGRSWRGTDCHGPMCWPSGRSSRVRTWPA